MELALIVAAAENGAIGRAGELPWRLPDDLKRFKALTMGHHLIVGRKTWETIGRPLPGRTFVVVTRRPEYEAGNALVVSTLEAGLERARAAGDPMPFVAGGGEIYRAALDADAIDRIYLTRVHATLSGDTYFAPVDAARFRLLEREEHPADARHAYAFAFETYARRT